MDIAALINGKGAHLKAGMQFKTSVIADPVKPRAIAAKVLAGGERWRVAQAHTARALE